MPRGPQPPTAGRPQTLREARRAYQKAGRAPSLSAAQIRAAERAVEADKRAKDILAKEKRVREAKKKREEQEAKQREEQRKLVQLGRLPEESLWGKVQASQPRLHSFFGVPPERKVEAPFSKASLEIQGRKGDTRARSVEDSAENSQDSGRVLSSAPAALNSQNISCLPALQPASPLNVSTKQHKAQTKHAYERSNVHAVAADRGQMDSQFGFPCSQVLSGFADDGAIEAELNGQLSTPEEARDSSISTSRRIIALQTGSTSRKRKVEDLSPNRTSSVKAARTISAQRPPSMLQTRALEIASASSGPSLTQPAVHPPAAVISFDDIPTASQVEAMFWSQDYEDNDGNSDKENLDPRPAGSKITNSAPKTKSIKSAAAESQRPPPSTVKLSFKERSSSQHSASRLQEDDGILDNGYGSDNYFDSAFNDDFDAELLELPSQIPGLRKDASQMVSKPLSTEVPVFQRSTPPELAKQASPLRSKVGDPPHGTQESYYDMQGVDDEDLLGLADMYNSSQNFG